MKVPGLAGPRLENRSAQGLLLLLEIKKIRQSFCPRRRGWTATGLGREGADQASVDAAQTQLVQGTNYRLDFTMSDGSRWRVVVYRALNGTMRAGQAQAL